MGRLDRGEAAFMTAGYSGTPLVAKLGIKPGLKVAAIDETWSGLKLVRRLKDR